jgi:hypothetical protein
MQPWARSREIEKVKRYEVSADVKAIVRAVAQEVMRARAKHPTPFHGAHDGYAKLLEEFDELWDEVKADAPIDKMHHEAVHVAAMAVRFIADVKA